MTQDLVKIKNRYMIRQNVEALSKWIEAFLRDCRARDLSAHTIEFYRAGLATFGKLAQSQNVIEVQDITPDLLRGYLIDLKETRNTGGVHAKFRALRAWLRWYQAEAEPEGWKNPIEKVRPPKVPQEPIEGVSIEVASVKVALSRPAHQRVTPAVGPLCRLSRIESLTQIDLVADAVRAYN